MESSPKYSYFAPHFLLCSLRPFLAIFGSPWSWIRTVGNWILPHAGERIGGARPVMSLPPSHTHTLSPSSTTTTPLLVAFSSQGLGYDLQEFRKQRTVTLGVPTPDTHPNVWTSGLGCCWGYRKALPPRFSPEPWQGGE